MCSQEFVHITKHGSRDTCPAAAVPPRLPVVGHLPSGRRRLRGLPGVRVRELPADVVGGPPKAGVPGHGAFSAAPADEKVDAPGAGDSVVEGVHVAGDVRPVAEPSEQQLMYLYVVA